MDKKRREVIDLLFPSSSPETVNEAIAAQRYET
jgi:hypothetical protein